VSAMEFFLLLSSPFVGSFISASAGAWPNWADTLQTRSKCVQCKTKLSAIDLVPVLSFFWLHGKCRTCKALIPRIHPWAEAIAVLVALASILVFTGWLQFITAIMGWVLLFGALVDIRLRILPDEANAVLGIGGLVTLLWLGGTDYFWLAVIGAGIGYGAFYIISRVYKMLRGRDGLGMGDAKLLAAGGAWLGPFALSWVVILAGIVALCGMLVMGYLRKETLKSDTVLSFGPALSLAIFVLWLWSGRDGMTINLL